MSERWKGRNERRKIQKEKVNAEERCESVKWETGDGRMICASANVCYRSSAVVKNKQETDVNIKCKGSR